jgi:hypothetical protein
LPRSTFLSDLPRSTFLSDFGNETLRSALSGRRESPRLFKATAPAIPASAAPPAISGVFAFEANSATFPPAFPIAPFELLVRARELVPPDRELVPPDRELVPPDRDVVRERELDGFEELLRPRVLDELLRPRVLDELLRPRVLDELLRPRVPPPREDEFVLFALLDEPFRLVDLLDLEPLRLERVLEDRVV